MKKPGLNYFGHGNNMNLVEICQKHNLLGHLRFERPSTDKEFDHKYCSLFYDAEFARYQNQPVSLLEIGCESGGSLFLWNQYFKNSVAILGVDTYTVRALHAVKDLDNVHVVEANAYEQDFVDQLPNFDIIIDDGPHTHESQCEFIKLYQDKLNQDGIMVIEDIQDIESIEVFKSLVHENKHYEVHDLRESSGMKDSLLFVIKHKV